MCRSESRLAPGPGAGCGTRTSPRPPGSAAPPAEKRPGSATRGLWEEGREGLQRGHRGKGGGQRDGKLMHTTRQALSADAGRGLTMRGGQASSVTKATVKVKDSLALTDKKFVIEHTNSEDMTDGAGNWAGTLSSCA